LSDVANKPKVKFEQVWLKFGKQVQAGVSCVALLV